MTYREYMQQHPDTFLRLCAHRVSDDGRLQMTMQNGYIVGTFIVDEYELDPSADSINWAAHRITNGLGDPYGNASGIELLRRHSRIVACNRCPYYNDCKLLDEEYQKNGIQHISK